MQPVAVASAWPCVSWPSTNVTSTSAQSIAPSSGSVTVTVNGMLSPNANVPSSTGMSTSTVGAVLPTVIVVFAEPTLPLESMTVELGRVLPGRRVGEASGSGRRESTVPLPSKSHSKRIESPGSASFEPALENSTVSGAGPLVGSAERTATGARRPLTYSHRIIPASGLMAKKPSP